MNTDGGVLALLMPLAGSVLAGVLLGGLFFGGLWATVRWATTRSTPALWFAGSLLVRLGIVVAGCVLLGREHPWRLAACLAGLLLARGLVIRFTAPSAGVGTPAAEGG